jgi:hypothetical protein
MLSELCHELKNWFEITEIFGTFEIKDGVISIYKDSEALSIKNGQYYRIVGSVFNDGVWQYKDVLGAEETSPLVDEVFDGAVWLLAIPREVIELSATIDAWKSKYATADSVAMSPFTSESFGGYSYSKAQTANGGNVTWQNAFSSQLNKWRKI